MEINLILVGVVALILGVTIAYFLVPRQKVASSENHSQNEEDPQLCEEKLKKVKAEYEHKLADAKSQLASVEKIYPQSSSGTETPFSHHLVEEIEQLKKSITDYEGRLDDAEFEKEKIDKKYKENKKEYDELKQSFDVLNEEAKNSKKNLEQAEVELNEVKQNLQTKENAVLLMNTLLDSPKSDNDRVEKNKAIDNIQEFVEDKLLVSLKAYNEINDAELKGYKNNIWNWANLARKKWLNGKKTVAFVGEFSAGKTSIVNRILSQDNPNVRLLPVSSKATTAIPTYISHNQAEKIEFTTPNGELRRVENKQVFEKITKETLEEVRVSSIIQYFINSYKNENLKGLSILDTPGFSSNDAEDRRRTAEVIKETDVLFWVVDANAGEINKSSIDIIREDLQGHPIFVIINKADTKSEQDLEHLQNHIKNTMDKEGINVLGYIKFSQKHSITELMEAIKSVPNNPNKQDYLKGIYNKLLEEVKEADDDIEGYRKENDELEDVIDDIESEIDILIEEIEYISGRARSLPEQTKSWLGLGEDYYKMDISRYEEFLRNLDKISPYSQYLSETIHSLKEAVEQNTESQNEVQKAYEQYNSLEQLKEDFEKLIKKWDKNYLNRVKEKKNKK